MTISNTDAIVTAQGNGVATEWPFAFNIPDAASANVVTTVIATGVQSIIDPADYTITGLNDDNGGEVVYPTVASGDPALTSATEITVYRSVPQKQLVVITNQTRYDASVVEAVWDRLTMMVQDLQERYTRSLHVQRGDTYAGGEPHIPIQATRALKVLGFDANGDMTVYLSNEAGVIAAAASAAAALVSENAAAASETAAGISETNAAASEVAADLSAQAAAAAAQGWSAVNHVTVATTNIETTDANNYYILDATSNTLDINLPAIGANDGLLLGFQVSNVDNAITIVRDGTDTINGVAGNYSGLISVGQVIHFIADDNSPDNWLATIISQVNSATDTSEGIVELATDAEAAAGTATDRALTPANVASHYSPITRNENADTSTALTLALTDAGDLVTMTNAAANVLTVPTNAAVTFAVGTQVDISQDGAGATTITGDTGVTINGVSAGSATLTAQWSAVTLVKKATNTWTLHGDHGGVA